MGSISNPMPVIPPNVVACVGGTNGKSRTYTLTKGNQVIVIQAPSLVPDSMSEADLWLPIPEEYEKRSQEYMLGLERIQTLLRSIEFGKTNWAYMNLHDKGGHWHINQKQKNLYRVRTAPWATLVEEREIHYVKWFFVDVRIGSWKGQEVDVILGYENLYLRRVEETMMGFQALRGLDLTYDILAHVVSPDGSIIGVVSEPEKGRLVQYQDRTQVYNAIAAVQRRKLIFNGISFHTIHILSDGRVRLSNLASIRRFEDEVKLREEGEKRHWKALENLFNTMDPANTEIELPPGRSKSVQQLSYHILADYPSPERLFPSAVFTSGLPNGFLGYNRSRKRTSGRARSHKPRDSVVPLSIESGAEESPKADTAYITDSPLSIQTIRLFYHPYRSRPRPKALLLANSAAETETPHHELD